MSYRVRLYDGGRRLIGVLPSEGALGKARAGAFGGRSIVGQEPARIEIVDHSGALIECWARGQQDAFWIKLR